MEMYDALAGFGALAQPTRLDAYRILVRHAPAGMPAGDLAAVLGVPANTLSAHLAVLARAGLVDSMRNGRTIVYRAVPATVRRLVTFLEHECCGGRPGLCDAPSSLVDHRPETTSMTDRPYDVLFLCTGNSARSILAESILRQDGAGRFRAWSAGSHPKGAVHPLAIEVLADEGYPTEGLRSKSWDEFAGAEAPKLSFVFTVCDSAAGEACPYWPGHPTTAHWGIEDPAAVAGTDIERRRAFVSAFQYMRNRIRLFTALPLATLGRLALDQELAAIGRTEGATR